MSVLCERVWIGITYEQYRGIYDAMGGDGAWSCYASATRSDGDQETTWCLTGRSEPLLKNRTRDGGHSYYLAVGHEVEQ